MNKYLIIGLTGLMLTGCARTNQLWFTDNGVKTKTWGEASIECEFLPDGTKKAKFSSKKGMSRWEKIANFIRPDKLELTGGK